MISFSSFAGTTVRERLDAASAYLRAHPHTTLRIEPGVYELTSPLAVKTMEDVLGGVYGDNPEPAMFRPNFAYDVGFDLSGMHHITVLAEGVTFLVYGFMEPVSIRQSEHVTVRGLTVDHKRKPFTSGRVVGVSDTSFDVRFDDASLLGDQFAMPRYAVFGTKQNRFLHYGEFGVQAKERLDETTWRITASPIFTDVLNEPFYAWHTYHSRPAVFVYESRDVRLCDVTLCSQPGMGVVAHRSKDLLFRRLAVVPSGGDHVSTNTDATHIVSCKGRVRYDRCTFEGQGDDSLNVHTYYHTVTEARGKDVSLALRAPTGTHSQKPDLPDVGDVVEKTDPKTLAVTATARVTFAESLSPTECRVTLDKDLSLRPGDLLCDGSQSPRLTVECCKMLRHIARGALVKTKRACIKHNHFEDVTGTAIEVAAESWWSEALCSTEKITITDNTVLRCGGSPAVRDTGGVAVTVDCDEPTAKTHRRVTVLRNAVVCPDLPHAVYVSNARRVTVCANACRCAAEPVVIKE